MMMMTTMEKETVLDSTSSSSTSSNSGSASSSTRGGNNVTTSNAADNNLSPSKMIIPSSSSISNHVLMPVGLDLEIDDMDNYQDIRIELNATGHNLTSVLINPRDTFYDDIFDGFAAEQSAPLDYQSPLTPSSSFLSLSSHHSSSKSASTSKATNSSSRHSMNNRSSSSSGSGGLSTSSSYSTAAAQFTTTVAEDLQLDRFIIKLTKIFLTYQSAHGMISNDYNNESSINNSSYHSMLSDSPPARRLYSSQKMLPSSSYSSSSSSSSSSKKHKLGVDSRSSSSVVSNGWFIHSSGEELRACYKEVPEVFFKEDFSLQSQATFNQVLQIKDHSSSKGLAPKHHHHHQSTVSYLSGEETDDLSHYLDLVEVALLRQIWYRSPAFFKALDDIKGLQYQVYETIKLVKMARSKLTIADKAATSDSIRIPKLSIRHRNLNVIQEKLLFIQQVVQARNAIASLLEVEEYFTAMELISVAKSIYHDKLSDISCMQSLGNQLHDVDQLVNEVMRNKFVSMAIQWDGIQAPSSDHHHQKSSALHGNDTVQTSSDVMKIYDELELSSSGGKSNVNSSSNSSNAKMAMKIQAETLLKQLLRSLILTNHIQPALNMYKSRLLEAIRLIVRTCVMEYLSNFDPTIHSLDDNYSADGSGSSSSSNGTNDDANSNTPFKLRVQEMSVEHFLSCLSMCFEHVLLSLVKANLFHQFIDKNIHDTMIAAAAAATTTTMMMTTSRASHGGDSDSGDVVDESGAGASSTNIMIHSENGNSSSNDAVSSAELQDIHTSIRTVSKSCIHAVCELAQKSIAQLINIRKEINSRMAPDKMRFLWEISLHFVLELESISGSTAYLMRQCLLAQTKSFLEYLHESSKGKLVVTLDNERWVQCDVSPERQHQLDRLTLGKAFLPVQSSSTIVNNSSSTASTGPDSLENLVANGPHGGSNSLSSNISNSTSSSSSSSGSSSSSSYSNGIIRRKEKEVRAAVIESVEYRVVWSVMLLSEIIFIYLDIAFNFSPVTTDVINKIVEMLRLFNTRAKQLVLGAQAIQSAARLKTISAKHLAITGQSLGVMIAQLPHIRTALLAQIPSKHHLLLTELDRITQEYSDHHSLIVGKFVNIVSDFIDASSQQLRLFDWDYPISKQSSQQQSCKYFEEVSSNISTLHRVLVAILPPTQMQEIFSRVLALLNRKIPLHFEDVTPTTNAGRQRILDEVSHLVTSFSRFKYVDATTTTITLEETFRRRYAV